MNPRINRPLDTLMEYDHVVAVMPDGRVIDRDEKYGPLGVVAPEVVIDYAGPFNEAQISKEHDAAMVAYLKEQGWEVLTGYSGQYGYAGPIMHQSEFIGGGIEERIREEPGYWVALTVEIHPGEDDPEHESNGGSGESDCAGWIVARKIGSEQEIAARTAWVAEDVPLYMEDPTAQRPASDEDATMSAPQVLTDRPGTELVARLRLATHLIKISHFQTVRQSGISQLFLDAAESIEKHEEYRDRIHGRVYRVRAVLLPKEGA